MPKTHTTQYYYDRVVKNPERSKECSGFTMIIMCAPIENYVGTISSHYGSSRRGIGKVVF